MQTLDDERERCGSVGASSTCASSASARTAARKRLQFLVGPDGALILSCRFLVCPFSLSHLLSLSLCVFSFSPSLSLTHSLSLSLSLLPSVSLSLSHSLALSDLVVQEIYPSICCACIRFSLRIYKRTEGEST